MDITTFLNCSSLLLLCSVLVHPLLVSSIGINYGQIGDNLPSPKDVIPLIKSVGANKVKLYDANSDILKAFADTDIEFIVGLTNEEVSKMHSPSKAQEWIKSNVQPYLPATKITCITVGNEVISLNDTSLTNSLLPAMQNMHAALVKLGLDKQVTVTTAHSLAILETSYPPSAGAFKEELVSLMTQILYFHAKTGSPFLINAYPYFAYKANPKEVDLNYVLFQPNKGTVDPGTNLKYDNMLFAQIDAAYAALEDLGYKKLPVHISETGWPSKGDEDEPGATPDNAKKYNGNLIKTVGHRKGTPMRPNCDLNIYVFALFNENMKPGPTSERNYGLFKPDKTPAYSLGISSTTAVGNSTTGGHSDSGSNSSSDSGSGSENAEQPTQAAPDSSSTGYLSISSATERYNSIGFGFFLLIFLIKLVL